MNREILARRASRSTRSTRSNVQNENHNNEEVHDDGGDDDVEEEEDDDNDDDDINDEEAENEDDDDDDAFMGDADDIGDDLLQQLEGQVAAVNLALDGKGRQDAVRTGVPVRVPAQRQPTGRREAPARPA